MRVFCFCAFLCVVHKPFKVVHECGDYDFFVSHQWKYFYLRIMFLSHFEMGLGKINFSLCLF